ncbi:hypothetical protein CGZ95_14420 [Enemella evansiae]|uniref:hypothetical protein n=1 Tax=Enemella evansiae TaxID=2016499 RepID=UPI000B95E831|nr:hypothetical protein [Enemella evansiae]OYN98359.1 hypothetical protein CGZ95_14420 [Enemella evansiae]
MSCEEFRAQVERTLHHDGAFLFRQQQESRSDPIGRIRGYADLPGAAVLWSFQKREPNGWDQRPLESSIVDGTLRIDLGVGDQVQEIPGATVQRDSPLTSLWWLPRAYECTRTENVWRVLLDPMDPVVTETLLTATVRELRDRGTPLVIEAELGETGLVSRLRVDADNPSDAHSAPALIELLPTPRVPRDDLLDPDRHGGLWQRWNEHPWGE